MARIVELKKEYQAGRPSTEISASYCVGADVYGGEKMFYLRSAGSKNRLYTGATSQVFSFDREIAKQLVDILTEEFQL